MKLAIALLIAHIVLLVLGYLVYRKIAKIGIDPKRHSIPEHTPDGEGVILRNKKGEPVIKLEKGLK
jgi:hypothetical protein